MVDHAHVLQVLWPRVEAERRCCSVEGVLLAGGVHLGPLLCALRQPGATVCVLRCTACRFGRLLGLPTSLLSAIVVLCRRFHCYDWRPAELSRVCRAVFIPIHSKT